MTKLRMNAVFGMTAALLMLGAQAAAALEARPEAGRLVAQRECGVCHAIGLNDDSPLPDAPRFRDLRGQVTTETFALLLANRMEVGHPRMPRLRLDDDELNRLLDYWNSLPGARQARLGR